MKILCLSNVGSGLKIFRGELLEAFLARGDQVYAAFPEDEYRIPLEQMGCTVIDTPFERRGMNPIKDLKLLYTYWKLLAEVRPDAVLTYTVKPNVYGGLVCRLKKIPYFSNVTGLGDGIEKGGWLRKVLIRLYRISLKRAQVVFCQNAAIRDFLAAEKIAPGRHRMIPGSGVNLERFQFSEYPKDEKPLRLIYIGRMLISKGSEELLKAAAIIRKKYPDVTFSAVGGAEADFEDTLIRLNADGQISIIPFQSDIRPYLSECHALINPAYYEGMSNVMLEAAAMGRPLIASCVPGHTEILDDGVNGVSCIPHDVGSLVDAIDRFIHTSFEQKQEMGKASREKVEREFDRNLVVNAYMEELEKVKRKER